MSKHIKNIIFILSAIAIVIILCYTVLFPYKYYPLISKASDQYHIPSNKIAAIIRAESNFDPNNRSKKGAIGLMQLMPDTAAYMGEKYQIPYNNLNDPEQNIMLGTAYLNYLEAKYKGKNDDLIAYNAGEGNLLSKKWKRFGETNRYLVKIHLFMTAYNILYFWR